MAEKAITERLPELREARGWSRERLSHAAFQIDSEGTSVAQITSIERGVRRASARTIAALAQALEVDPEDFPEYRLALARHVLDEGKVGLDVALENLDRSGLDGVRVPLDEIKRHSHRRGAALSKGEGRAEPTSRRARSKRRSR